LRTVDLVRDNLNPRLEIQGLVLTMYDPRNNLSKQVSDDVRSHFGDTVYKTVIPRNVRVSEAPSFGKPALIYDHKCAGSKAYMRLASEVIRRENKVKAK
jgi:chromosome partitioning protein